MLCTHGDPIVFTFMEIHKNEITCLFETLLIEIDVSTRSLDFCS